MDIDKKASMLSIGILVGTIIVSAILYFVFHIVFIVLIFIPPVIYYLLRKREKHGTKEDLPDRFRNSD